MRGGLVPVIVISVALGAGPAALAAGQQLELDSGNGISLEVPHAFERAAARERVSQLLQFWREAYGVVSEWRGDLVSIHGRVHGVAIHALFEVSDGAVFAVARDPGWFWRAHAHSYVERMLKKYLHPTYQERAGGW